MTNLGLFGLEFLNQFLLPLNLCLLVFLPFLGLLDVVDVEVLRVEHRVLVLQVRFDRLVVWKSLVVAVSWDLGLLVIQKNPVVVCHRCDTILSMLQVNGVLLLYC